MDEVRLSDVDDGLLYGALIQFNGDPIYEFYEGQIVQVSTYYKEMRINTQTGPHTMYLNQHALQWADFLVNAVLTTQDGRRVLIVGDDI